MATHAGDLLNSFGKSYYNVYVFDCISIHLETIIRYETALISPASGRHPMGFLTEKISIYLYPQLFLSRTIR